MFNGLEIQFIGNLTRDPELRYLPSGSAVCNLSVAVNSVSTGADGERQERTDYVRATLWGKSAENANQYLVQGQEVICRGRGRQRLPLLRGYPLLSGHTTTGPTAWAFSFGRIRPKPLPRAVLFYN